LTSRSSELSICEREMGKDDILYFGSSPAQERPDQVGLSRPVPAIGNRPPRSREAAPGWCATAAPPTAPVKYQRLAPLHLTSILLGASDGQSAYPEFINLGPRQS